MYELLYREERIQRIWLLVAGRMRNPSVIISSRLFSIPVTMLLSSCDPVIAPMAKAKETYKADYFHVRTCRADYGRSKREGCREWGPVLCCTLCTCDRRSPVRKECARRLGDDGHESLPASLEDFVRSIRAFEETLTALRIW